MNCQSKYKTYYWNYLIYNLLLKLTFYKGAVIYSLHSTWTKFNATCTALHVLNFKARHFSSCMFLMNILFIICVLWRSVADEIMHICQNENGQWVTDHRLDEWEQVIDKGHIAAWRKPVANSYLYEYKGIYDYGGVYDYGGTVSIWILRYLFIWLQRYLYEYKGMS